MAINATGRAKLVRRLLDDARLLKEWAASEGIIPDNTDTLFDLALTVTEKKKKTVVKYKKKRGKAKLLNAFLKNDDWAAIKQAIKFSTAEAPLAIFEFFRSRKNRALSEEELDELPYLKETGQRFTHKETTYLNVLLRQAGLPYNLRSIGRGERAYRFFIVEAEEAPRKSNERQLDLFENP